MEFKLHAPFQATGDQPEAIDALVKSIETGNRMQTLKGVTGSGKTYTMAKVIERVQRPTLVLAHNKTLAAQLCEEFRAFFPENAVEYFISYYDYYQPEAYIAHTDTYIEKDASVNEERVLVTTLTKKMAEDLTVYLQKAGIKVRYMHSDIGAMERMEIIRDMRMGKFDVLVGINLLREGLDLPEVSLVAILDADKEGFLRSETSLIQTIGRAARNAGGRVIMYADSVTPAMRAAIDETARRREIQDAYNKAHGIVPKTIIKSVRDLIEISSPTAERKGRTGVKMTKVEKEKEIARLEKQMKEAAKMMEYEYAAVLRDQIIELRGNGT